MNVLGIDVFTNSLQTTIKQFEESDNYGSLIKPDLKNVNEIREIIFKKELSNNQFLNNINTRILKIINQTDYLSQKYHVVITNPPYMGNKSMNIRLSNFKR